MVIPQSVISGWMTQYNSGSELEKKYPDIDLGKIIDLMSKDRPIVRQICFEESAPAKNKIYLATAGAPCAGKSTVLEQMMHFDGRYRKLVKVDPDRWAMLFMLYTYVNYMMSPRMIASAKNYQDAQIKAYDVCRPASNIISLEIMNDAIENGYSVAHGTTLTSPHIAGLLQSLKNQGYEVHLLVCMASDETRASAANHRCTAQGYYQSTPEDVREKGILLPQRMQTYFEYADELGFFWRKGANENATLAAQIKGQKFEIVDHEAYQALVNYHDTSKTSEIKTFSELLDLRFSQ
jgi:predicted ABC-type ATPase